MSVVMPKSTQSRIHGPTLRSNLSAIIGKDLELPTDFVVLDIETTGLSKQNDRIWQVGLYSMLDGKVTHDKGQAFWLAQPPDILRKATFEIARRASKLRQVESRTQDKFYRQAEEQFIDEVTTKGTPPRETLEAYIEFITESVAHGITLVGQNFVKFDIPFLEWECRREGLEFKRPESLILDVGILIKAAQMNLKLIDRENLWQFYTRVSENRAKGVYFALERFCVPYWELDRRYGLNMDEAHDAGFDCFLTNLVLRELVNDAQEGTDDG